MRQRRAPQEPIRLKPSLPGPMQPYEPYKFEAADASAVQALARGEANADQQRLVLDLVISKLACTFDMEFRPGGDEARRASDFAAGKRFVGAQMVKLANISINGLLKVEKQLAEKK